MKNNLFILTKVLIKGGGNTRGTKKKSRSQWILLAIIVLAFAPMIGQLAYFTSSIYNVLSAVGIQGIILSMALTLSAFVIFFFGIFYVMNTFYFTNDIESLLPLPVRPFEILGAKFVVVTVYEYLTELIIILPVLIVYGIKDSAGLPYYIYAMVVMLVLPVIPLVIASLIIMPLMRFTGIVKNKDRFRLVGGIIALFIGLGVNIAVQRFTNRAFNPNEMLDSITQMNKSLDMTTRFFPSSKFAALGLVHNEGISGLANVLLFLAISAVAVILFLYLGELLYFKGVMGVSEVSSRRKRISGKELDKKAVKNPAIKTYLSKELKLLFRTPVYFMNCVLMNFLWPVFLLIPFFAQSSGSSQLSEIAGYLSNNSYSAFVLAAGFGLVLFVVSSSGITSTSISREGQNLYIAKYIPLSYRDQIMGKVLSGVFIGLIGMFMMIIAGGILFKIQAYMLALLIIVGLLAIFFGSFSGMILDLFNPKLNWDNEQKAVKQNMNMLINMLICIIFAGLNIFLVYIFNLTLFQTLAGLVLLYGLFDLLLYYIVSTVGVGLLAKIEN